MLAEKDIVYCYLPLETLASETLPLFEYLAFNVQLWISGAPVRYSYRTGQLGSGR